MRRAARCFGLVSVVSLVWIGQAIAGANQWTPVGPYRHGGLVTALAIDPQAPRTVYAGTNSGLFRSTDAGGTWAAVNDGFTSSIIFDVAIDPVTTSTVYAVVSYPGGVFKSTDSGRGWKVNGHFWLFYGALSNVEYTIIVTDTVTGSVRSHHNARDTLESVADTSAF